MAGLRHPAAASPWPPKSQPRAPAAPAAMLPSRPGPKISTPNLKTSCFKTVLMTVHSTVASLMVRRLLRTWRPRMRRGPAPRSRHSMPTSTTHANERVRRGHEQYNTGGTSRVASNSGPRRDLYPRLSAPAPCPSGSPHPSRASLQWIRDWRGFLSPHHSVAASNAGARLLPPTHAGRSNSRSQAPLSLSSL